MNLFFNLSQYFYSGSLGVYAVSRLLLSLLFEGEKCLRSLRSSLALYMLRLVACLGGEK